HVHVDDLRAAFHLLPGHCQRSLVIARENELREFRRTGYVGSLTDVYKIGLGCDRKGFQSAQTQVAFHNGRFPWSYAFYQAGDFPDVVRCRAATTAHHIDETMRDEIF